MFTVFLTGAVLITRCIRMLALLPVRVDNPPLLMSEENKIPRSDDRGINVHLALTNYS